MKYHTRGVVDNVLEGSTSRGSEGVSAGVRTALATLVEHLECRVGYSADGVGQFASDRWTPAGGADDFAAQIIGQTSDRLEASTEAKRARSSHSENVAPPS